jgi:hypothetical protein
MADVFLSYKSEDRDLVAQVARALEREGFAVWWDRKIRAGGAWRDAIVQQIHACRVVVAAWSRRTEAIEDAAWMLNELDEAKRLGLPVIPVKLTPCEPPFGYRHIQAADLSDWRGGADHAEWSEVLEGVRAALSGRTPRRSQPASIPRRRPGLVPVLSVAALGVLAFGALLSGGDDEPQAPADLAASEISQHLDAASQMESTDQVEATGIAYQDVSAPEADEIESEATTEQLPDEQAVEPGNEADVAQEEAQSVEVAGLTEFTYAGRGVRGAFVRLRDGAWMERNSQVGRAGVYHVNRAQDGVLVLHDWRRDLLVRVDLNAGTVAIRSSGEAQFHPRYQITGVIEAVDSQ